MKKIIFYFIVLLFISTSCTPKIAVTKTEKFEPTSSITIIAKGRDELGIQSQLEHIFLTHGFDVISEATAQEKIKFQQDITSDSNSIANRGEIGAVTEIESVYALTFQYKYRTADYRLTSFNASVVNMYDGRLVASTNFSQGSMKNKNTDKILDAFVSELIEQ